jgi:cell wall-associated NlpC family hydrolase
LAFVRPRLRAAATFGLAVATIFGITSTAVAAESLPTVTPSETIMAQAGPAAFLPVDKSTAALLPDSFVPDLFGAPADLLPAQFGPVALPAVLAEAVTAAPIVTSANSLAARVIRDARSHLGARYVHGAKGPRVFDCIGLVLRSYADAGAISKLGGWSNGSGYALYAWARRHHLTSTTHGQPGDVVVWGGGGHVGIYLGNGRAISALVSGVRIHGIHAVTKRFTAFIHTGVSGLLARSVAPNVKPTTKKPAKSIGVRHVARSIELRVGHSGADRVISKLKKGTKLTLLHTWRDHNGKLWYRVNANRHVGWVVASSTRT